MLRHQTRSGLSALVLLILLLTGCGSRPQGLIVVDDLGALLNLDVRPLTARGASVVIVLTQKKAPTLEELGRAGDPRLLAIIVSQDPRHSELRAGKHFSDDLSPGALERIRAEVLNPQLQAGRYQLAFTLAAAALEKDLARNQRVRLVIGCAVGGILALYLLYLIRPETFAFLWARREAERARQRALQERAEERVRLEELGGSLPEEATTAEIRAEVSRLRAEHLRAERLVEWRRRAYAALATLKPTKKKKKLDPARYEEYRLRLEGLEREAPPDLVEQLVRFTEEIAPTPRSSASYEPTAEGSPYVPTPSPETSSYNPMDYSSSSESSASGDW